jgi:hypothetical protein
MIVIVKMNMLLFPVPPLRSKNASCNNQKKVYLHERDRREK